jgi:hypothetical protein
LIFLSECWRRRKKIRKPELQMTASCCCCCWRCCLFTLVFLWAKFLLF